MTKKLSLSEKISRLHARLHDSQWRQYGSLLLIGKLTGIGLLVLMTAFLNPGLLGMKAFAADPDRYFTRAAIRMLSAEQILDAISAATGVAETFKGYPPGTRALELAEGGINHPFLQAFSKPVRVSPSCSATATG